METEARPGDAETPAMMQAVADLHRAFFTGLVLATVARRGPRVAAELRLRRLPPAAP